MSISLEQDKRARPVIVAGKIYVLGADGFRAAKASGVAGMTGSMNQPDGYYVRMPSGVRLHDKDGEPFVFIKREGKSGFIVSCSMTSKGVRYMFGTSEMDLAKLGLSRSVPGVERLEQELAERLLWETSPESAHTVYELHQRAVAAEAEYVQALDRVYGPDRAPETRYWKTTHPTLEQQRLAAQEASAAWQKASRFSQTPAMVRDALAALPEPSAEASSPLFLVARWTAVDTASFQALGPREEMGAELARLSDDLDARVPGPAVHDPIPLVDTNGVRVGEAVFVTTQPEAPIDGKPMLVVPVKDLERTAIAVTDVFTNLQSSIEDVHRLSHVDGSSMAHFYWRNLPTLERDWHRAAGASPESLQATHERVWQQLVVQDRTNPDARFQQAYQGLAGAAESLGLQPCLQGFGDSARVGYFKDGEWTGIASEIALNGKVLTTLDGQRAAGTGYTADGEWQRDQLESALYRYGLDDTAALENVYEANADLYAEADGP